MTLTLRLRQNRLLDEQPFWLRQLEPVVYDPKYLMIGQEKNWYEIKKGYLVAETAHSGTERLLNNLKGVMSYRAKYEQLRNLKIMMYTTDLLPDH